MPKLLIFAPCEKVLIDQTTNSLSLIAVLQEVHYKLPPGSAVPPNFSLPIAWSALSLWQEESADAGVIFEQRITVENRAGSTLLENVAQWEFTQPNHRIVASVLGLPVYDKLSLNLFFRVVGSRDWHNVASFPISLIKDVL
ncbi:MAG: hypothetical protein Q7S58_19495 [Candidatus Binatus sp.]|uniref:hypothetical protein n=1 Tax=Candidatus Binatus sp. TaxID=2811406 RepID=UPI00271C5DFE|nr:hypothetical protein [Candidatus Binatus sp.]MDO8434587.1 hypothetical protein [Candidatus Binatus sp.]